jgi:hypothetical protein
MRFAVPANGAGFALGGFHASTSSMLTTFA